MVVRTLWLTGLPGSGKTTLATLLLTRLQGRDVRVELLDGDSLRAAVGSPGFSPEERRRHLLYAAYLCQRLNRHDIWVVAAFVSPYRAVRDEIRNLIGPWFREIYLDCPLEICEKRDPKGLYARFREGKLPDLTGPGSPYEAPIDHHLTIKTGSESIEKSLEDLFHYAWVES